MDHNDDVPRPVPDGWLEAMDESDADLAAGRTMPAAVVHAELRASIARLEVPQLENADRTDQPKLGSRQSAAPSRL